MATTIYNDTSTCVNVNRARRRRTESLKERRDRRKKMAYSDAGYNNKHRKLENGASLCLELWWIAKMSCVHWFGLQKREEQLSL